MTHPKEAPTERECDCGSDIQGHTGNHLAGCPTENGWDGERLAEEYAKSVPDYCELHNIPMHAKNAHLAGSEARAALAAAKERGEKDG